MELMIKLLTQHWSYGSTIVFVGIFLLFETAGYRYLRSHKELVLDHSVQGLKKTGSNIQRKTTITGRVWLFSAGSAVLLIAMISPINYWSNYYLWVHMIQHIFLMLVAPFLIIVSAPWSIMYWGIPNRWRHRLRRTVSKSQLGVTVRAVGRFFMLPKVSIILFSTTMVIWMIPALFDFAMENPIVQVYVMDLSMFLSGIVLFSSTLGTDYPSWPRASIHGQIAGIMIPGIVMWLLAMALGMFSQHSLYLSYAHMPGVTMSTYGSQQIAAAELWVCGDFSLVPAFELVVMRFLNRDQLIAEHEDQERIVIDESMMQANH